MGAFLILLLLALPAFGQVWGTFPDLAYMHQASPGTAALPIPTPDVWYVNTNGFNTTTDGGIINSWDDNSGNGRHLQRDPVYNQTPRISYNAAEATILCNGYEQMSNNYAMTEPFVVMKVMKALTPSGQYTVPDMLSAVGVNRYARYDNNAKKMEMVCGNVVTPSIPLDIINKKIVLTEVWNGTNSVLRINGFPFIVDANHGCGATPGTPIRIGGGGQFGVGYWGYHYEIKGYGRLLTSNELYAAEWEMFRKWGIYTDIGTYNPTLNDNALAVYDIANITTNNGSTVASIPDSGPNAYHLRTTNAPRYYVDYRTNDYAPHIGFNIFGMSGQMAGTNFTAVYPKPVNAFFVMDTTGSGTAEGSYDFIVDNSGTPGTDVGAQDVYKYNSAQVLDNGAVTTLFNGENSYNGLRLYEFYWNGQASYIKTNSVYSLRGAGGVHSRIGINIAGSRGWDIGSLYQAPMNLYFAGFYTNLQSATSSNIQLYLKNRFKLPLTPVYGPDHRPDETNNIGDMMLDYWTFDSITGATRAIPGSHLRDGWSGANGATNVTGIRGNAGRFSGDASSISDAYIMTGGTVSGILSTNYDSGGPNSWTISVWLKAENETSGKTIMGVWGTAQPQIWNLRYSTSTLEFRMLTGESTNSGYSNFVLYNTGTGFVNNWMHIAFGYDGSVPQLWFQTNGGPRRVQRCQSDAPFYQIGTNGVAPFRIMGIGNLIDGSWGYQGSVDEMGYWNRTLSTNDVAYLYGSGTPPAFNSSTWTNNWRYKWP